MRSFIQQVVPAGAKHSLKKLHSYYESWRPITRRSASKSSPRKSALLSYITIPFKLTPEDGRNQYFSNIGIARSFVEVLNDLGFDVDIIEWSNTLFRPRKSYDLFIGHAGRNFERLVSLLPEETPKIYFSTGLYWREHNRREEERFQRIEDKYGVRLPYDRRINHSEEGANAAADGIICLGNSRARDLFSKFPLVINVNNASYADNRYDTIHKDFEAARNNFLFFSSNGNVHKGLDLLLEAFEGLNAHLYVCQNISSEFRDLYRKQLEGRPNIHVIGSVPMRTPQFYDVIDRCGYIIHPSCSEGQPGSVIECMHQGLTPILNWENVIDIEGYGVPLRETSVDDIAQTVQQLTQQDARWLAKHSKMTREIAQRDYTDSAFRHNISSAIQTIIASKRKVK